MRLIALLLVLMMSCAQAGDDGSLTDVQPWYRNRHDAFMKIAKAGGVDLLFLGDSITDFWRSAGKAEWATYFAPLKAANFGIQSDRTNSIVWRLRNGELEGIHPKLVVLMIGTNNGGKAEDVVEGIKLIITEIQQRSPGSRILLLGIFPRGERPNERRLRNEQVNKLLEACANPTDPKMVVYMDIGAKFLAADQTLSKEIMPDFLHPSAKGYQIWAEAIIDTVKLLMQDGPVAKPAKPAK